MKWIMDWRVRVVQAVLPFLAQCKNFGNFDLYKSV
jgi:hypothetical protein